MSNFESEKLISLKIATEIIKAMEVISEKNEIPITIAIANKWGLPIAVHLMDGALPASYDIAVNKAYTSATIRISTEKIRNLSKDGGDLFGINNTNGNKIISFPGGFPLSFNGEVFGAIGVSGGTADYDNKLALLGKKNYEEVVKWIIVESQ